MKPHDTQSFTDEHLNGFRYAQNLAYTAAVAISREIREGWTEIQAAKLLKVYLQDYGVRAFFHEPFAWFGDRTRFARVKKNSDFSPSQRRFIASESAILDVAPLCNGYVGDIGYSFCLCPEKKFHEAQMFLKSLRKNIPIWTLEYKNAARLLWDKVDQEIRNAGYDNIHQKYPFSVLGHRVHRLPLSRFPLRTPVPFSLHAFFPALRHGVKSELLNQQHKTSMFGLWAVEPHIGCPDFGVKFEEILVVEENEVRWLDNNVPHYKGQLFRNLEVANAS